MDITEILSDWHHGDPKALERLMPLVFNNLRAQAKNLFFKESPGHTLQPTALVNELYIRLADQHKVNLENRGEFYGLAALLMRRLLVDHARSRYALKRGREFTPVTLESEGDLSWSKNAEVIAIDDALRDLARLDPMGCKIVELKYFVGLSHREIAEVLNLSHRTVRRRWTSAKLWLYRQLSVH